MTHWSWDFRRQRFTIKRPKEGIIHTTSSEMGWPMNIDRRLHIHTYYRYRYQPLIRGIPRASRHIPAHTKPFESSLSPTDHLVFHGVWIASSSRESTWSDRDRQVIPAGELQIGKLQLQIVFSTPVNIIDRHICYRWSNVKSLVIILFILWWSLVIILWIILQRESAVFKTVD